MSGFEQHKLPITVDRSLNLYSESKRVEHSKYARVCVHASHGYTGSGRKGVLYAQGDVQGCPAKM